MIRVTRLNHEPIYVNAELIEYGRQLHQSPERRLNLALVSPIDDAMRPVESA